MKDLLHAFVALPEWQAIALMVGVVVLFSSIAWLFAHLGFHAGCRHQAMRHMRVTQQRRELSSIQT